MDSWSLFANELFKVSFDIPTPRPHFIITRKDGTNSSVRETVENLGTSDLNSLLSLVQNMRIKYGFQDQEMILSFHTGSWVI